HPQTVLKEVLAWTNGQPFLTQKICQLILNSQEDIPPNQESQWVENLVRSQILENWESQDEPEHLRTIRDRILHNPLNCQQLLKRYQNILHKIDCSSVDDHLEKELILSGLIIKKDQYLTIHNRIYGAIFNDDWLKRIEKKGQIAP
ncbi:MAG: diguanylate cyclase, partial [Cyanobacteria bacterium P01_G01_bin.49]